MRYILPCFLGEPIRRYHQGLVDEIAARFDLPFTRRQAIPAHFTLKYHFETDDVRPVEAVLAGFARAQAAAPVTVAGFGHFDEDVVYVTVTPSPAARAVLAALVAALRALPWMAWSPHDGDNLRPHMTVAEFCRPRFAEVWRFVQRGRAALRRRARQPHPAPPGRRGGRRRALGRAPRLSARGRRRCQSSTVSAQRSWSRQRPPILR